MPDSDWNAYHEAMRDAARDLREKDPGPWPDGPTAADLTAVWQCRHCGQLVESVDRHFDETGHIAFNNYGRRG